MSGNNTIRSMLGLISEETQKDLYTALADKFGKEADREEVLPKRITAVSKIECPACGGRLQVLSEREENGGKKYYTVACLHRDCVCRAPFILGETRPAEVETVRDYVVDEGEIPSEMEGTDMVDALRNMPGNDDFEEEAEQDEDMIDMIREITDLIRRRI